MAKALVFCISEELQDLKRKSFGQFIERAKVETQKKTKRKKPLLLCRHSLFGGKLTER
jgi:hypothetical protein